MERNPLTIQLCGLLAFALFPMLIMRDETEPEIVPPATAAVITFMGARLRFYRTEGKYSWTGKFFLLGRSTKVSLPGTDENGFIYLGDIPIRIWNNAVSDPKDAELVISSVARDSSTIYATLTIVLCLFDPKLWLDSQDPITDVAERARAAFRTSVSFFVGTDVTGVKSIIGRLMSGKTVLTAFIQQTIGNNIVRSILQNKGGVHQYRVVSDDETEEEGTVAFLQSIISNTHHFESEMLEAVKDRAGSYVIESREVDETLEEVANASGASYVRASIGDISLSPVVESAANMASSEVFQRAAQEQSAAAIEAARKKLIPTKEEASKPGFQEAMAIAAAQDNPNIQVIFVPGADSLTRAAVAGANQIGKGKDKK